MGAHKGGEHILKTTAAIQSRGRTQVVANERFNVAYERTGGKNDFPKMWAENVVSSKRSKELINTKV